MKVIPGSGAVVQATFNTNYGVQSFTIVNGGTGYASTNPPQVVILDRTAPTIAGSFYPIIADGEIKSIKILSSGSGYYPLVSIGRTAVGIASLGISQDVAVIRISNPGIGYTQVPTVTIAAPPIITGTGNYQFNEIVIGSRSKLQARVKSWDADTRVLKVSMVGVGTTTKTFYPDEVIVGTASSARYSVKTYEEMDLYDKYSQNDEIEEAADLIVDFSESNPFGSY